MSSWATPRKDPGHEAPPVIRRGVLALLERFGYELRRLPGDLEPEFDPIVRHARRFTGVSVQRCYALYQAVGHVVRHHVPGAFVECGVEQGGSSILAALTFKSLGDIRDLYLYDTFAGMPEPGEKDVSLAGTAARPIWRARQRRSHNDWAFGPLEEVKRNMATTDYPPDRITYVEGRVEETIPGVAPESIAVLRLDTDWFDSTWHELVHLYPRLQPGGVLYIDDYGIWRGARDAVDRYFAEHPAPILLHRIDGGSRIGVKPRSTSEDPPPA